MNTKERSRKKLSSVLYTRPEVLDLGALEVVYGACTAGGLAQPDACPGVGITPNSPCGVGDTASAGNCSGGTSASAGSCGGGGDAAT
jgi:hypothetical protein